MLPKKFLGKVLWAGVKMVSTQLWFTNNVVIKFYSWKTLSEIFVYPNKETSILVGDGKNGYVQIYFISDFYLNYI